jgi:hypothetical protein
MLKMKSLVVASALAVLAGGALAVPVKEVGASKSLGSGAGSYSFSAKQETAFFVSLGAGTYTFTLASLVENGDSNVSSAWLSTSKDNSASNGNDFGLFNVSGSGALGSLTETITVANGKTVKVYLNLLGSNLEKGRDGDVAGFSGTFNVSAVPEPNSAVMLLAGLGLMGAVSRRRKVQG